MEFENLCPISYDQIDTENSILVKVPADKDAGFKLFKASEKTKYYYLANMDILNKLASCPFTKRNKDLFFIQLNNINETQLNALIDPANDKLLIEDIDILAKTTQDFPWSKSAFVSSIPAYNPLEDNEEDLDPWTQFDDGREQELFNQHIKTFLTFLPLLMVVPSISQFLERSTYQYLDTEDSLEDFLSIFNLPAAILILLLATIGSKYRNNLFFSTTSNNPPEQQIENEHLIHSFSSQN